MDNQYLIKAPKLILIAKIHEKIDFQNLCWARGNRLTIRVGISSQIPMTLNYVPPMCLDFCTLHSDFFLIFLRVIHMTLSLKFMKVSILATLIKIMLFTLKKIWIMYVFFLRAVLTPFFRKLSFLKLHNSKWHFATFYQK